MVPPPEHRGKICPQLSHTLPLYPPHAVPSLAACGEYEMVVLANTAEKESHKCPLGHCPGRHTPLCLIFKPPLDHHACHFKFTPSGCGLRQVPTGFLLMALRAPSPNTTISPLVSCLCFISMYLASWWDFANSIVALQLSCPE